MDLFKMDDSIYNCTAENADEYETAATEVESIFPDTQTVGGISDDLAKPGSNPEFIRVNEEAAKILTELIHEYCSDSSSQIRSSESIKITAMNAKQAGFKARQAAISCSELISKIEDSIHFAEKRSRSAKRKANLKQDNLNKKLYRLISYHFETAAFVISENGTIIRTEAERAELSAKNADACADRLFALSERDSLTDINDLTREALGLLKEANIRTFNAKKAEYVILQDMKSCWEMPLKLMGKSGDVDNSSSIKDRPIDWSNDEDLCSLLFIYNFMVVCVISSIFPILSALDCGPLTVFTVGILLVTGGASYAIVKIAEFRDKQKRLDKTRKINEMIRFINGRQDDLKKYFIDHKIEPNYKEFRNEYRG